MQPSATKTLAVLFAASLLKVAFVSAALPDLMTLEAKIPLGEVRGRIDHLALDPGRHRLYVAELGNGSLGVVDLDQGKVIQRISGLSEPQGVAYVPGADLVYVAQGGDGALARFKADDLAPTGQVALGSDPDNIRVDPTAQRLVVGYGDGLALLEAASGRKTGAIPLAGHPESFQLAAAGRIFVNVPEARQIAVVDAATGKQTGAWSLPHAGGNFPMALDTTAGRLVVVYRDPAVLGVFDMATGAVLARVATCGDADDVFADLPRGRLYVSCGEGMIDILQRQGDGYAELGRVPTAAGARTALFVPELDRLFLAVRANGSEPAAIWIFRPIS